MLCLGNFNALTSTRAIHQWELLLHGYLKIHDLLAKVQDSKTGRKKKQTRSSLPKLLRFDMGSNVSVATNVYWECVGVCVCVCVGGTGVMGNFLHE